MNRSDLATAVLRLCAVGLCELCAANLARAGEPAVAAPQPPVSRPVEIAPVTLPTADYRLQYEQSFGKTDALGDFVISDPQVWRIAATHEVPALELMGQSRYQPPVRSPVNLALIRDRIFGDFVLECDLMQTGREYGHRDMCLFFGFESPSRFYYAHIATAADDHAHNIFVVNDQPRTKVATETTKGVNWGLNVWHRVRVERTIEDGMIKVYFDDLKQPIMVAVDRTFGAGYVGFGSFDDTGMIANVRIWGPAMETKPGPLFVPPKP